MIVFDGNDLFVKIIFQRFFHVIDDFQLLIPFKIVTCDGLKWFDKLVDSPLFEKVKRRFDEKERENENCCDEDDLHDYVDLVLAPPNGLDVDQDAAESVENERQGGADLPHFAADGFVCVDVGDWKDKIRGWGLDCCDALYAIGLDLLTGFASKSELFNFHNWWLS